MNHSPCTKMSQSLLKSGFSKASILGLFLPLLLASHAAGAVILWDASPTNVNRADPSQMSTTGTLVTAVSAWTAGGAAAPVVNGVTFQSWASATNFTAPSGTSYSNGFTTVTTEYQKLAAGAAIISAANSPLNPWVLSGLNINDSYQIQIWVPAWSGGVSYVTQFGTVSNGTNVGNTNNSPSLTPGDNVTTWGQFIFGTFTADGTTQNIYQFAMGGAVSLPSAFQVRDLGAVPEPQTWALLGLGGLALTIRFKSRQRRLTA